MASPFALSVIAWISAVFIPGPVRGSAPEAKPSASEASAGSTAIINVTVIDILTGTHRTGVTVLIHADRIAAIAPSVSLPPEAMRVDGTGKFLIPGLWDMHTQHQGTGADCLDLFVTKGIVGTRDMGGDAEFILPLRERVRSGAILGPEIVAAGPILDDAPPCFPYRQRVRNAVEASLLSQWFVT